MMILNNIDKRRCNEDFRKKELDVDSNGVAVGGGGGGGAMGGLGPVRETSPLYPTALHQRQPQCIYPHDRGREDPGISTIAE